MAKSKLSPRHQAFVREYLVDLNSSAAYLRAGYKTGNPNVCGPRLLAAVGIQAAVTAALKAREARGEIKQDRVLKEIALVAFLDPLDLFAANGTLLPLDQMPPEARRAIAGLEVVEIFEGTGKDKAWIGYLKKIKLVSKEGTLTLAARHLGMLVDKTALTTPDGKEPWSGVLQVPSPVTPEGWEQAARESQAALKSWEG